MIFVREFAEADIECACRLEEECFSFPWSEKSFKDAINADNTRLFSAHGEDGEFLGHISFGFVLDEAEIYNIAVCEFARGRGVGTELLNAVFEFCAQNRITSVMLEVRTSNSKAKSLYNKNGFEKKGIRKGFYSLPKEDAETYIKQIKVD